jgi:hypothetical protein
MTSTSIVGCWLLKTLEMLQNHVALLDEAISPRAIEVKSTRLREDKK